MQILPRSFWCVTLLTAWTLLLGLPSGASAGDLRENAFFKALEGTWKGAGQTVDAEGTVTDVTNKIEAGFTEDGTMFVIKGNLVFKDMEIGYRWEYTEHSIEGLYSAKFIGSDGNESLYDASIDETSLVARVVQISGTSGSTRVELDKKIVDGKYQTTFAFIEPSGETTFSGALSFVKE